MKKIIIALLVMATALAITPSVLADPLPMRNVAVTPLFPTLPQLNGTIGLGFGNDTWTLTGAPTSGITLGNTTGKVEDVSGSFSIFTPFTTIATAPGVLLFNSPGGFTFTAGSGGEIATFTITSMWVTLDNGTNLNISGIGNILLPGYALTPANFNLDSTDASNNFGRGVSGVGSSTLGIDVGATPTPEPGSLILLGTGLIGLAKLGYRKAKASGLVSLS